MNTIGICEDDDDLRSVLMRTLRDEAFEVRATATGREAVQTFTADPPDLLVLDIGLPDADGRDVCQALRAHGVDVPVLFLTARGQLTDRLSGFHAGGDDYLTKPFALAELVVRVRALLRRSGGEERAPVAGLRLDPARHGVSVGDRSEPLTPTEFRLMAALAGRPGAVAAPPRAGARRVAGRRDRARQHARRLHRTAAAQAARPRSQRGDRDRARRRLRPAVSLRNRVTLGVAGGARHRAGDRRRRTEPGARQPPQRGRVVGAARARRVPAGDARHERTASDGARGRRRRGARPAGVGLRSATVGSSSARPATAELLPTAKALGTVSAPTERSIDESARLLGVPAYDASGRRRVGTVVVGISLAAVRAHGAPRRARHAAAVAARARGRRAAGPPRGERRAATRGQHDRAGRPLGRARPPPALRPRPAARRAHRSRRDARRPARSPRRGAAPRAALLGRGRARAAHAAQRCPRRGRAGAARPAQRRRAARCAGARAGRHRTDGRGHRHAARRGAQRRQRTARIIRRGRRRPPARRTADRDRRARRRRHRRRRSGPRHGRAAAAARERAAPRRTRRARRAAPLRRRGGHRRQRRRPGRRARGRRADLRAGFSDAGGAGLGLALSRRLARAAGGEVVVAGSSFELRLPSTDLP